MVVSSIGYELELGDVPRDTKLNPKHGSWEYCETDIVNLLGEYKYIAADPLGKNPPVGGEINVFPAKTVDGLLDNIGNVINSFKNPTISCLSQGHVHVRVKGLRDNIRLLKRVTRYIYNNQKDLVDSVWSFTKHDSMTSLKGATNFMKHDGGRLMPEYMVNNILNHANNFETYILMHRAGKDHRKLGRPYRYAVNTYNLKHMDTIEFRCFRGTLDLNLIENKLNFVVRFMEEALGSNKPVNLILRERDWKFPPMFWDENQYKGWLATKYDKTRGKKERKLYEI